MFVGWPKGAEGWVSATGQTGPLAGDDVVTDVRPLVVLDLDSLDTAAPDQDETVAQYVVRTLRGPAHGSATRNAIADQIEAQTKPPRIPEPGKYGIVKASLSGDYRSDWVNEGKHWVGLDHTIVAKWDDLVDPALVREGV